MPNNHDTDRSRQRAARALAKAENIPYVTALARLTHAPAAGAAVEVEDDTLTQVFHLPAHDVNETRGFASRIRDMLIRWMPSSEPSTLAASRRTANQTSSTSLPDQISLPGEGSDEFLLLEQDTREGRIPLGHAFPQGAAVLDLDTRPHWLLSGPPGTGKTNLLRLVAWWALRLPDHYQVTVCDLHGWNWNKAAQHPGLRYACTLADITDVITAARDQALATARGGRHATGSAAPKRHLLLIDDPTLRNVDSTITGALADIAKLADSAGVHLLAATQKLDTVPDAIRRMFGAEVVFGDPDRLWGRSIPGRGVVKGEGDQPQVVQTFVIAEKAVAPTPEDSSAVS